MPYIAKIPFFFKMADNKDVDDDSDIEGDDNKKDWFGLVWFYGISTIVGYLMPNQFLCM